MSWKMILAGAAAGAVVRHSMSHVEGYMARLAEDPEAVDGPGDRTFDPPVVWSKR